MWERFNVAGQQAMSAGRQGDAENQFRMAVQEAEKFPATDNRLATSLNNLANCLRAQGKFVDAEPVYLRAIQAKEASDGPFHDGLVSILENYAKMLKAAGREKEAGKYEQRARGIFMKK